MLLIARLHVLNRVIVALESLRHVIHFVSTILLHTPNLGCKCYYLLKYYIYFAIVK